MKKPHYEIKTVIPKVAHMFCREGGGNAKKMGQDLHPVPFHHYVAYSSPALFNSVILL